MRQRREGGWTDNRKIVKHGEYRMMKKERWNSHSSFLNPVVERGSGRGEENIPSVSSCGERGMRRSTVEDTAIPLACHYTDAVESRPVWEQNGRNLILVSHNGKTLSPSHYKTCGKHAREEWAYYPRQIRVIWLEFILLSDSRLQQLDVHSLTHFESLLVLFRSLEANFLWGQSYLIGLYLLNLIHLD